MLRWELLGCFSSLARLPPSAVKCFVVVGVQS